MKIFYVWDIKPVTETPTNEFIEQYILKAIDRIPDEVKNENSTFYAVNLPKWVPYNAETKYFKTIEGLLNHLYGVDFKNVHIIGHRDINSDHDLERGLKWLETVDYYDRVFDFEKELDLLIETPYMVER
jgi:hypothetical protein